jgi:hypothetical protein
VTWPGGLAISNGWGSAAGSRLARRPHPPRSSRHREPTRAGSVRRNPHRCAPRAPPCAIACAALVAGHTTRRWACHLTRARVLADPVGSPSCGARGCSIGQRLNARHHVLPEMRGARIPPRMRVTRPTCSLLRDASHEPDRHCSRVAIRTEPHHTAPEHAEPREWDRPARDRRSNRLWCLSDHDVAPTIPQRTGSADRRVNPAPARICRFGDIWVNENPDLDHGARFPIVAPPVQPRCDHHNG